MCVVWFQKPTGRRALRAQVKYTIWIYKENGHSGNCKHPGTSSSLPAGKTSSKEVGLLIKNNWDAYKHTQSRWVSVQRNVVTQRQLFCLSCSLSTPLSSSLFPLARPSTSFSPPLPSLLFHVTTAVSQSVSQCSQNTHSAAALFPSVSTL